MTKESDHDDGNGWSPDPSDPDVRSLSGFMLGRGENDGDYRLYLNSELSQYAEFPKEAAVHAKRLNAQRTIVYLRPGTQVKRVHSRTLPVEFLQGEIQRGMFRGAGGLNLGGIMLASCPGSGCAHCTTGCSDLPGGTPPDTAGFTCHC